MSTEITKQQTEVAKQLDFAVLQVIGQDALNGFEKGFKVASAIALLKESLSEEFMKPIMLLQGTRLGFKTDKDREGGYHVSVVKQCLVDATLMGLEVTGNQWNIIASNLYVTKEGCEYLLAKIKGLKREITPLIPKIDGNMAYITVRITWSLGGGEAQVREIDFAIKVSFYKGTTTPIEGNDAIMGKATRKARAWLLTHVTGVEIPEGDASESESKPSTANTVPIGSTATNELSPQAEKVANSTSDEVTKAKEKKAKAEQLAGKPLNVPNSIEDAKVVDETKTETTTESYKEIVLRLTPPQIVYELKKELPYISKETFEGVTGQKLNAKTATTLLIDHNENILEVTLDKIYGTSSDKLKAFNVKAPKTEAAPEAVESRTENDPMTQMSINDEFIENDIEEAAKELKYDSSEAMLKYGSLKETAEYVKSKKA